MIPAEQIFFPIYTALGRALSTWAQVENELGRCYAHCKGGDANSAMQEYWGTIGFSTRSKKAAKAILPALAADRAAAWDKLASSLKAQADRRNELAHGSIGIQRGWPILAPYYFARITNGTVMPPIVYRVHDIDNITNDFIDILHKLMLFRELLGDTRAE